MPSGSGRCAGRARRVAGRVEVGRHPRAAHRARRSCVAVVARRRLHARAVSGREVTTAARRPAGRDRARRRAARLSRRSPAALLLAAAARLDGACVQRRREACPSCSWRTTCSEARTRGCCARGRCANAGCVWKRCWQAPPRAGAGAGRRRRLPFDTGDAAEASVDDRDAPRFGPRPSSRAAGETLSPHCARARAPAAWKG